MANLLVAVGDVRIVRGNIILDKARAGCLLYEGDLVETGADGYAEISCSDGSTFHARANSCLSVEAHDFAGSSSSPPLIRIMRGVVGFLAGRMARDGRLTVETPSATVRALPSALATSGIATLLLLFVIDAARAASEEILVLDSDDVTFKDLHYGTFEIVTKGQNPQVIVVDDPGQSVVLRPRGSGFSVELVANSLSQMRDLQAAYKNAYDIYARGQLDPFFQLLQRTAGDLGSGEYFDPNDPRYAKKFAGLFDNGYQSELVRSSYVYQSIDLKQAVIPQGTNPVTIAAVVHVLPISKFQIGEVPFWPHVSVSFPPLVFQRFVSITILNVPAGYIFKDAAGIQYQGSSITIPAGSLPALTLTTPASGVSETFLEIYATMEGLSGLLDSVHVILPLTLDLDSTRKVEWVGTVGAWNTPANWSTGAVPLLTQDVVVDGPGVVVTSTADVSINSLLIGAGATLKVSGSAFRVSAGDATPLSNAGSIRVESGGQLIVGNPLNPGQSALNTGSIRIVDGSLEFNSVAVTNYDIGNPLVSGVIQVDGGAGFELLTASIDGGILINAGTVNIGNAGNALHHVAATNSGVLNVLAGAVLLIDADGSLDNSGDFNVAGTAEFDDTAVTNTGTLDVLAGGQLTLDNTTTVDNDAGDITVAAGGILNLDNAAIDQDDGVGANPGTLAVSAGGTLNLQGSAQLTDGALTNAGTVNASNAGNALHHAGTTNSGILNVLAGAALLVDAGGSFDNSGDFNVAGAAEFDDTAVTNTGTFDVLAGGTLTLDATTTLNNDAGDITIAATGTLNLNNAAIDQDDGIGANPGTLAISAAGTLNLQGSAQLTDGTLSNSGDLNASNAGNALHNVDATNTGTLDVLAGGTLTLDNTSTLNNDAGGITVAAAATLNLDNAAIDQDDGVGASTGTLAVSAGGFLNLQGAAQLTDGALTNSGTVSASNAGNALHRVNVTNSGALDVLAAAALLIDAGGTLDNSGDINIFGTAEIDDVTVTNSGALDVLAAGQLTLDNTTTVDNDAGDITVAATGTLNIDNAAVDQDDNVGPANPGTLTVSAGATLNLQGAGRIIDGTLGNSGDLNARNAGNVLRNVDATNGGTIDVLAGGTLTLDNTTTIDNEDGAISVAAGGTLVVDNATIDQDGAAAGTPGTLTVSGILNLTGNGVVADGTLSNSGDLNASNAGNALHNVDATNTGTLDVLAGGTLTLDTTTTVNNDAGDITVAAAATLNLNNAAIDQDDNAGPANPGALAVSAGGLLNLQGAAQLTDGVLTNAGTVAASNAGNALHNADVTNTGTIDVLAGSTLTLDTTTTVNNDAGDITVAAAGILNLNDAAIDQDDNAGPANPGALAVSAGGTLNMQGPARLTDGVLTSAGTVNASNAGNALHHVTAANSGILNVLAGGALLIDADGSLNNAGDFNVSGTAEIDDTAVTNTGTLDVLAGGALTLDNTTTLDNDAGDITVAATGTLNLGNAAIDQDDGVGANAGALTVSAGGFLNLQGSAQLTDGTLTSAGTITSSSAGNALHNADVTNTGSLDVLAGGTLTLDATTTVNNDAGDMTIAAAATLNLSNAAIDQDDGIGANPGALAVSAGGTLNLQGSGQITDGTLSNSGDLNASNVGNALHDVDVTNTGTIDVLTGGTLTFDTATTANNDAGDITVATAGTLNLNNAAIDQDDGIGANAGTLTVSAGGTLNLQGSGQIADGTLSNSGDLNASNAGNALHNVGLVNTGTLDVLAAGTLLIDAGGSLNNSGDFNVGGTAEIDDAAVTNTGTLDVLAGGTLTIDNTATVDNDAGDITVAAAGTLNLNNASIDQDDNAGPGNPGTLTVSAGGSLNLQGSAQLTDGTLSNSGDLNAGNTGNALHNVDAVNTGTIDVLTGGTLTLDTTTTVNNDAGDITVAAAATLNLNDAAIDQDDGVGANPGTLAVSATGTLNLQGSGRLTGGSLSNGGDLNASNAGNALRNVDTINTGTIDVLAGGTLALDTTTTVNNDAGDITIAATGTLDLNNAAIDQDDGIGANAGALMVSAGGTLNLQGSGQITDGSLSNSGDLNASNAGNALHGVDAVNAGTIDVLAGGTLTLDATTTLNNDAGEITVAAAGTLNLNDAAIDQDDNAGAANPGTLAVSAGGTLSLQGSGQLTDGSLTNAGTISASNAGNALHHVSATNSGVLDVVAAGTLLIDTGGSLTNAGDFNVSGAAEIDDVTVTNTGTLDVLAGGTLTVDNTTTVDNEDGAISVAAGGTLVLDNATIDQDGVAAGTPGTLTVSGILNLTGNGVLTDGTLNNSGDLNAGSAGNALHNVDATNTGTLDVLAGGTLTLDSTTTVNNDAGDITVAAAATLNLNNAAIDQDDGVGASLGALAVSAGGTLNLQGSSQITDGALSNSGDLNASNAGNALHNVDATNTGAIDVLAGGTLTLDATTTVSNDAGDITVAGTGTLNLNNAAIDQDDNAGPANPGTLTVSAGGTLNLQGSGRITDGTLVNSGDLNASNAGNALHHASVTNSGTLDVLAAAALRIDAGGTLNNSGDFNVFGAAEIDDVAVINTGALDVLAGGTLTLDNTTTVDNDAGDITVAAAATLNLNNAAIDQDDGVGANPGALAVSAGGVLNLQGSGQLTDGSLTNAGTVNAGNAGNALHNVDLINSGTLDVLAAAAVLIDADGTLDNSGDLNVSGAAEIDDVTVTNTGTLDVLAGGTLTLDNTTTVDNEDGAVSVAAGGTLVVGNATIDQDGAAAGTPGTLTVSGILNLTGNGVLTDGTLSNSGDLNASNAGNALHHVTATNSGTLDVLAAAALLIDADGSLNNTGDFNVSGTAEIDDTAVTNTGTLDVLTGGTLTLDNTTALNNDAGEITVAGTGILNLNNAAIDQDDGIGANPGTLAVSAGGFLNLQGSGQLTDGSLANAGTINTSNAGNALHNVDATNTGSIDVLAGSTLTLDTATTVNNDAGDITVAATGTLNLNDAAIDQDDGIGANPGTLAISASGTLNLQGSAQLTDGILINAGKLNSSNAGNALHNVDATNTGTIDVLAGSTLTLDTATTVNNDAGGITVAATGILNLDNATIDQDDGVGANPGTLAVVAGGTLNLTNSTIRGGTLTGAGTIAILGNGSNSTLGGLTIAGGTTVTVNQDTTLTLDGPIDGSGEILIAGASTLVANGTVSTFVNAAALADDALLTLQGSSTLTVINLDGDLSAGSHTGNITVTGGAAANIITTGKGADSIIGFAGNDQINGGNGSDTIVLAATSTDLNAALDTDIVGSPGTELEFAL